MAMWPKKLAHLWERVADKGTLYSDVYEKFSRIDAVDAIFGNYEYTSDGVLSLWLKATPVENRPDRYRLDEYLHTPGAFLASGSTRVERLVASTGRAAFSAEEIRSLFEQRTGFWREHGFHRAGAQPFGDDRSLTASPHP